jgi:hypothetical protein
VRALVGASPAATIGATSNQPIANHSYALPGALTNWKTVAAKVAIEQFLGGEILPMSGKAILENVRRYRAIASLYRQTAAFRPLQRWSLLERADEWERLALAELEAYYDNLNSRASEGQTRVSQPAAWQMLNAA